MKNIAILMICALASCTTAPVAIEPIPGSITYGGQPHTKLTKVPPGSSFSHDFRTADGRMIEERYVVDPDRSLRIISQRTISEWPED